MAPFDTDEISTTSSLTTSIIEGTTDKKLRYASIDIIEFPMEVGDNPSVSQGAPIMLGREVIDRRVVDVYLYEVVRESKRRTEEELKLSAPERAAILLRAGVSFDEIVDSTQRATEVRKQREESFRNKTLDGINEALKSTGRKVKKVISSVAKTA